MDDIIREICKALDSGRARGHRGALLFNLDRRVAVGFTYTPRPLARGEALFELYVTGRPTGAPEVAAVLAFESVWTGAAVGIPAAAYTPPRTVEVAGIGPVEVIELGDV